MWSQESPPDDSGDGEGTARTAELERSMIKDEEKNSASVRRSMDVADKKMRKCLGEN